MSKTKTQNNSRLIPTIGIECHTQLKTLTKLFAAVGNDARQAHPNTLVSHICFGMPGALPVLNAKAVELAIRAGFALHTDPQKYSHFERKHYFYPDSPNGYQITQLDKPIVKGGYVQITIDDTPRNIRINRIQMEADAGKSTHRGGQDYSLVDLNRAGTPLLEIVSEPDMHSAREAKAYARELWLLMRYADVSDANLFYGNMRFDVNVSLSIEKGQLGIRTETKNLNSFRSVEKAVDYEIKRQTDLLKAGKKIIQETRGWDDDKQKTFSQRSKEDAHDYRYFPEPDIPPIELSKKLVETIRNSMPIMPDRWREILGKLGLEASQQDSLLEAELEQGSSYLSLIQASISTPEFSRALANWFVNTEVPLRRDGRVEYDCGDDGRRALYEQLYDLTSSGKLSSTSAKHLLTNILEQGINVDNLEKYAEIQGHIQVSSVAEIAKIVDSVLNENANIADDIKSGEMKAIGFLVGQVMKKSLGKANPSVAQKLIKKQLGV